MKIAIAGYGKMGKTIESIAKDFGHKIVAVVDTEKDWETKNKEIGQADVIIEFTMPSAAPSNIRRCFNLNIPVVSGTTGWHDQTEIIKKECLATNNTLLTAPNFSIGVNIFFYLNRYLAKIMNRMYQYDLLLEEVHHQHKLDSPSGTAKLLADDLISLIERKESWINSKSNDTKVLQVISTRLGEVPGTHLIRYFSDFDEIEIKHTAVNRLGFARGALMAAERIKDKKGFFTFTDLMEDLFEIIKNDK
jgi:4-hydroxy-tetrahydrodipicolinate reductase